MEQKVVAGKFQKLWVASEGVQICTRNFSTLVELTGTKEWLLQAMHYTMELCVHRKLAIVLRHAGESPSATSALFIAHWLL